jgi:hypothetical protein
MGYTRSRQTICGITTIALLASILTFAPPAPTAEAGAVDSCGGDCQNIGLRVEEYDYETAFGGDCYGACGPGCSYVCSSGGACLTHDFYMRKHGLWSWQQFSTFPPALVQWGACMTGRGIDWVGQNIVSKVTGAVKWIGQKVAGIFN